MPEKENSVAILFGGWVVDIFETSEPATRLGLTVERAPAHEDNPSVDIFVERSGPRSYEVRSPDAAHDPGIYTMRRARQQLMEGGLPIEACFQLLLDALDREFQSPGNNRETRHAAGAALPIVSAMRGYMTEFGTTDEQDALLRAIGVRED